MSTITAQQLRAAAKVSVNEANMNSILVALDRFGPGLGTPTGSSRSILIYSRPSAAQVGSPPVDAKLEAIFAGVLNGDPAGVTDIIPNFWCGQSNFSTLAQGYGGLAAYAEAFDYLKSGPLVLRTPCIIRTAGTPDKMWHQVTIVLRNAAAVSLDLTFTEFDYQQAA